MKKRTATNNNSNNSNNSNNDGNDIIVEKRRRDSIDSYVSEIEERDLGFGRLVALIFFQTSGGPFGIEQTVSAGGPLFAVLQAILLPFLFNLPIALTTSEMSTALPHDGGLVLWSHRTFGSFWSFQISYWYLAMGILSNAALPNQLTDYLNVLWPGTLNYKFTIHGITVILCLLLNVRGSKAVGSFSVGASILLLTPFIIMVIIGLPHMDVKTFTSTPHVESWTYFLAVALWSQGGWDGVSLLAGEIKNIGKVFFPAMMASLIIVGFTYFLPIFVGVGIAHDNISLWKDGYFSEVAQKSVQLSFGGTGHWMKIWMSLAGMISAFGLLAGSLCTTSRSLYACASIGLLPKPFCWIHSPTHTPWFALLFQAVTVMFVSPFFNFESLVRLNIAIYCVNILFSFAVFYYLRRTEPELPRPYCIPFSTNTIMLLLLPCMILCIIYIIILDGIGLLAFIIILVLGPLLFFTVLLVHRKTTWFLPLLSTHGHQTQQPTQANDNDTEENDPLLI